MREWDPDWWGLADVAEIPEDVARTPADLQAYLGGLEISDPAAAERLKLQLTAAAVEAQALDRRRRREEM